MARKPIIVVGLLATGFALGLVVPNALYIYGDHNGIPYRVNRLTGIQQYTSQWGWVSEGDIDRRVNAKIEPEIARFNERLAQMRLAANDGTLRKLEVMGRQVSAYYADGRKEEYYATDLADPRLTDVEALRARLLGISTVGSSFAVTTTGG